MDHSAFQPSGSAPTDTGGMTPIGRLIPQDSTATGNGQNYTEQPPRMPSGQGAGNVPPMNPPMQTRDAPPTYPDGRGGGAGSGDGGDIVNDILRDVERGASIQTQTQTPPQHPYQDQRPTVRFETPPSHDYNQHAEDPASMLQVPSSRYRSREIDDDEDDEMISDKDSESGILGNNFVGTILKETRLPILVAGLIFVAGLANADDMLIRLVPALFQNGNNGYAGLIVKAVIGGLLFYAVRRIFI